MEVEIFGEFIKLSQLLKKLDFAPSGGTTKFFVKSHKIKINGVETSARNAKVRVGDVVWIDDNLFKIVAQK